MKSKKILDAARDQECTLHIVGICNYKTDTTVFAHLPDESNGMGKKSDDISGCFSCSACHDFIDGRTKHEINTDEKEFYMRRAMVRTWRILINMRVIKLS